MTHGIAARRAAGKKICAWLAARVRAVAPSALGGWDRAWELVEAPSVEFLDALDRWERTGRYDDRRVVQEAGGRVVSAWRRAAEEWEQSHVAEPPIFPSGKEKASR